MKVCLNSWSSFGQLEDAYRGRITLSSCGLMEQNWITHHKGYNFDVFHREGVILKAFTGYEGNSP